MNRPEHRALVEAGYAPLDEYVRKYSMTQTVSERLRELRFPKVSPEVYQDLTDAADLIDELVEALEPFAENADLANEPGLLLEMADCRDDDGENWFVRAAALIAKAKGESA